MDRENQVLLLRRQVKPLTIITVGQRSCRIGQQQFAKLSIDYCRVDQPAQFSVAE